MTPKILLSSLILLLAPVLAGATDWRTDQRIRIELAAQADLQGELVELQDGSGAFAAIHRPRLRGAGRGAVILAHGAWSHPDDVRVIRPLAIGLAEAGWDTLSIQLPPAYPTQSGNDWLADGLALQARMAAAAAWFKQEGQLNQVLLTQGLSASIGLQFATGNQAGDLQALVLVSPFLEKDGPGLTALGQVNLPVLDITAEREPAGHRDNRLLRRSRAGKNTKSRLTEREIAGAPPDYRGVEDVLLSSIRAWLAATVDGQAVPAVRR